MRHHYVPQFLLRAWAETVPDKKVETFRLDLPHIPSSRRSPRHVAYEENLYALTLPVVAGMDQHAVEKQVLKHIDTLAAAVLRRLTVTGFTGLTLENRCDWTRFLMSLRLRQPSIIQQLRTEVSEHLEASLVDQPEDYNAIADFGDPPTLVEWTRKNYPGLIENFGLSFFNKLVDNAKIGGKILRMKWWLWHFTQDRHELLLADHPCIFTAGIDDPDLVIALPIGPRKAFMASGNERIANILRQQRPKHLLMRLNESSLAQARARIYARDGSAHRFIANRLIRRRPVLPSVGT